MSCIPSGMPLFGSRVGKVSAGVPQSVQVPQKSGSPVVSSEAGAMPMAAGVSSAS